LSKYLEASPPTAHRVSFDGRDRAAKPPTRQLSPTLVVRWAAVEAMVSSLRSVSLTETLPFRVTVQLPVGMATLPSTFTEVPSPLTPAMSRSV
jgi:hypothetical protein